MTAQVVLLSVFKQRQLYAREAKQLLSLLFHFLYLIVFKKIGTVSE